MTYPELCPDCNCPIQLLYDAKKGETYGDIHLAMAAHYRTCHPLDEGQTEVTE